MATYNYKCSDCGNTFDVEATIQEKEEGANEKFACPKCKSKNIKQEFSATNFIKNVFKSDGKAGGCCSGGNVCDISCKPDEEGKSDCGDKNSNSGCCG
jgi:putative FmdB family regulatory protein